MKLQRGEPLLLTRQQAEHQRSALEKLWIIDDYIDRRKIK